MSGIEIKDRERNGHVESKARQLIGGRYGHRRAHQHHQIRRFDQLSDFRTRLNGNRKRLAKGNGQRFERGATMRAERIDIARQLSPQVGNDLACGHGLPVGTLGETAAFYHGPVQVDDIVCRHACLLVQRIDVGGQNRGQPTRFLQVARQQVARIRLSPKKTGFEIDVATPVALAGFGRARKVVEQLIGRVVFVPGVLIDVGWFAASICWNAALC